EEAVRKQAYTPSATPAGRIVSRIVFRSKRFEPISVPSQCIAVHPAGRSALGLHEPESPRLVDGAGRGPASTRPGQLRSANAGSEAQRDAHAGCNRGSAAAA